MANLPHDVIQMFESLTHTYDKQEMTFYNANIIAGLQNVWKVMQIQQK